MRVKIIICLLFLASITGCGKKVTWFDFKSPDGKFRIQMPSEPKSSIDTNESPIGKIDVHIFSSGKDGNEYVVGYSDYPVQSVSVDHEKILDNARDGFLGDTKYNLIRESRINFKGHPGRHFEAGLPDQNVEFCLKMYLVKSRLYQILVAYPSGRKPAGDAEMYFNSFQLTEQ